MITCDSVIPLYEQVSNKIQEKINKGELKPGDRVGSINELIKEYDVSRVTAVNAIEDLVKKGFAVSRQGKGTFVRSAYIEDELMSLRSFREISVDGASKIISYKLIPLTKELKDIFRSTDIEGFLIRRLQFFKNDPIGLIVMALPRHIVEKAAIKRELLERSSMFEQLDNGGVHVVSARQVISAKGASAEVASILNICEGSPILHVTRTSFDAAGAAVMYSTFYYKSDSYSFTLTLNRK